MSTGAGSLWTGARSDGDQELSRTLSTGLTRADLARYAGASGDVNAVHVDDAAAAQAGHPSVIAHGMYVMGASGAFLQHVVGQGRVTRYRARFHSPVLLGDSLHCTVRVLSPGSVEISTVRGDGTVVMTGSADVSPPEHTEGVPG